MHSLVFYREEDGSVPILEWFERLPQRARVECIARIELLRVHGHRLRRPHADYLRDDVYELRVKREGINYRMLYCFHGQQSIVMSHGIVKQRGAVPPIEIERAKAGKAAFKTAPAPHTYKET